MKFEIEYNNYMFISKYNEIHGLMHDTLSFYTSRLDQEFVHTDFLFFWQIVISLNKKRNNYMYH